MMNSPIYSRHGARGLAGLVVAASLLAGCTNEANDLYARERAYLRLQPVTAIVPLYTALNSPGQFCAITIGNQVYKFSTPTGASTTYPFSAQEAYGKPECIAGFVVGVPSVPDLNMSQAPVAYDLACPTCYEQNLLQRSLTFTAAERLTCSRCHNEYDLSNGGLLVKGDGVKKLYRYRITYNTATNSLLVIN